MFQGSASGNNTGMSEDPKREQGLEAENGELLPDREVMSRVWPDPDPVLVEPDPSTLDDEYSPDDPPQT